MSRSERLLDLLQILRRYRGPISGRELAAETGVSIRTLYRDIATLQGLGITIEGEAGVGYVLKPGSLLPPLMFPAEEIEALVLGAQWVERRGDDRLRSAARNALARIGAVVPADLEEIMSSSFLLVGPGEDAPTPAVDLVTLRTAIRAERKIRLVYRDGLDRETVRVVWPFALAFFDSTRLLVGWCELREGFRHFRTDRIVAAQALDQRYPRRRRSLLQDWRIHEGHCYSTD